MTIGKRISVLYALPATVAVAACGIAIANLQAMNLVIAKLVNDSLPGTYSIGRLSGIAKDIRGNIRGHVTSSDQAEKRKAEADLAALRSALLTELEDYQKSIASPEDRRLFASVAGKFDALLLTANEVRPLSNAGKTKEAMERFRVATMPAYQQVQRAIEEVYAFKRKDGNRNAQQATFSAARAANILWAVFGISVPFCAALGWFVVHGLTRVLKPVIRELGASSREVNGVTRQIAGSADSLARDAAEQAASLEETSAASEQIHSTTQQNLGKTQEAAQLMAETAESASRVTKELEQTMAFMTEMDASSGKVAKIIQVIDEIAFQTNILALNAAVEAARAGEAGMGFAVVADEVRSLAHRSAQAARDTAQLIHSSIGKSKQGCRQIERIFSEVRQMSGSADRVKTMVDQVSTASLEQARGIEQISHAISQMDQVTQRTAASAQESASAGHQLSARAESLRAVVEDLRRMTGTVEAAEELPVAAIAPSTAS